MNEPPPDPYQILGVPQTATAAEITRAYRRQLRAHHPDTRQSGPSPEPSTDPDAALRRILAAYAVLRDPDRRAALDRQLSRPHRAHYRTGAAAHPVEQPPIRAGPVYWKPS